MRPATRAAAILIALGAAGGASGGCDWRDFDNLQGMTPVVSVQAPSGYATGQDFGRVMLAVSPPANGTAAARVLVSAADQTALAIVDYDVHGHSSSQTLSGNSLDLLATAPVTAMAEVPSARQALLGSPESGNLLLINLEPPFDVTPFFASSGTQLGAGVAAGPLGGGAADDLVALSRSELHVFVDGQVGAATPYYTDAGGAASCPIFLADVLPDRLRRNRAVVVARLLGGTAFQIAVGTPVVSGPGSVSIFDVDTTAGTATCALTLFGSSSTDSQFGAALAVGDFDGDGISDLLVGDPPLGAVLYRGPISATPTSTVRPMPGPGIGFGAALAAIPLDAKPGDEALIADPDATVGTQMLAGNVSIFTGATLGTRVPPTAAVSVLADRSPSVAEAYGSTVAALPFCAPKVAPAGADGGADAGASTGTDGGAGCVVTHLPLVGASAKVFTYFTLGPVDPRAR